MRVREKERRVAGEEKKKKASMKKCERDIIERLKIESY